MPELRDKIEALSTHIWLTAQPNTVNFTSLDHCSNHGGKKIRFSFHEMFTLNCWNYSVVRKEGILDCRCFPVPSGYDFSKSEKHYLNAHVFNQQELLEANYITFPHHWHLELSFNWYLFSAFYSSKKSDSILHVVPNKSLASFVCVCVCVLMVK